MRTTIGAITKRLVSEIRYHKLVVTLLPLRNGSPSLSAAQKNTHSAFLIEVEIEIRATRFIFRSDPGHRWAKGSIGFQGSGSKRFKLGG